MPDDCFICKAEEWGVAVATSIDDNAADEKSSGINVSETYYSMY